MLMRLLNLAASASLVFLCACAALGVSDGDGKVTSVRIDPPSPVPGGTVAVLVEAIYDGAFPQMPGADRPPVHYEVTRGELFLGEGHGPALGATGAPELRGTSITTAWWDFVYWKLPTEPGTYKLSATLGSGRTLLVTTGSQQ